MELYAAILVFAPFLVGLWMLIMLFGTVFIDGRLARILNCLRRIEDLLEQDCLLKGEGDKCSDT